jgi:hypothetical protein
MFIGSKILKFDSDIIHIFYMYYLYYSFGVLHSSGSPKLFVIHILLSRKQKCIVFKFQTISQNYSFSVLLSYNFMLIIKSFPLINIIDIKLK